MNTPNPKWHFVISMIKSVGRLGAGAALISGQLYAAGVFIIIAEVLGIAEELV